MNTEKKESTSEKKEKSVKLQCPEFSGKDEDYDAWRILVEDWLWLTKGEVKGQGVVLRQHVKGKALDMVLNIEKDIIRGPTGGEAVLERLDEVYKKDKIWEKYGRARAFLKIERKSTESIGEYLNRYENVSREFKNAGGKLMEDDLKAVHLMEQAKLTDFQIEMVLTGCGKDELDYETTRRVMKRIFDRLGEEKSKEESWAEGMKNMNIGRGEGMKNTNFGRFERSEERRRDQKNPMRYGKVSQCAICSSEYHWARQCPKNAANRNGSGTIKETESKSSEKKEGSRVYVSNEEEKDYWSEIEGILDTGCKSSLIGQF